MEIIYKIFNDESGDFIEVGPDQDGVGLIEIRDRNNGARIIELTIEQAELVVLALQKTIATQKNKGES